MKALVLIAATTVPTLFTLWDESDMLVDQGNSLLIPMHKHRTRLNIPRLVSLTAQ